MAITTEEKARRLEDAWDSTPDDGAISLRATLRAKELEIGKLLDGGSLAAVSANGRSSTFAPYGPGQITTAELANLYRQLITELDDTFEMLTFAAANGIAANRLEMMDGLNAIATTPANPPVTVDPDGYWANLIQKYGFDSAANPIVNVKVNDGTIFLWMLDHLIPIREARSDYSRFLTGGGMQWA